MDNKNTRNISRFCSGKLHPTALHDLIEDPDEKRTYKWFVCTKSEKREYDPDFIDDFIVFEGDAEERAPNFIVLKNLWPGQTSHKSPTC